jgi:hypothetical protein
LFAEERQRLLEDVTERRAHFVGVRIEQHHTVAAVEK